MEKIISIHVSRRVNRPFFGITLALLGYLGTAAFGMCAKLLPNESVITILFFQFSLSFILTLPIVLKNGFGGIKTEHPYLMGLRCVTGLVTLAAFFSALRLIPLANASLLQNAFPLFTPLIAWMWLKKKFSYKIWFGIVLGIIGLIFILKPNSRLINIGAIFGLCSGISAAFSLVTVRLLDETEPTNRILFYFFLSGTIFLAPFFIINYTPLHAQSLILLVSIGILTYLAQMFNAQALLYAGTTTVSSLGYSTVIFAGIFGWLVWRYIPDTLSFIGMGLVFIGGTLTTLLHKQKGV
jgi:drug/metabolite transporter (DMT)-like permease